MTSLEDLDVTVDMKENIRVIQQAISDLGLGRDSSGSLQVPDPSAAKTVLENMDVKIDQVEDYFWRPLDSPEVYSTLKDLSTALGDTSRAQKYERKMNRIKANDLEFKGRVEAFYGNHAEALVHYEEALTLAPDHPLAGPGKEKSTKSLEKARKDMERLEKSMATKSSDGSFWYKYGVCMLTQGRLEDAIESFDKATKFTPENPDAWAKRGTALESMKRYEEARPFFQKALELKPNSMIAKRGLNYVTYFTQGG
ncbi:MAG: tetratricopeptide repeat protein, partial [Thermoplasmata archaeon]